MAVARAAGGFAFDNLGASVAGGVDLNGDGWLDFAVGAPYADPAGADSGRDSGIVFLYSGKDAHLEESGRDTRAVRRERLAAFHHHAAILLALGPKHGHRASDALTPCSS